MTDILFVRSNGDKAKRHFYVLNNQNWLRTDFSNIAQGNRFFYLEDGKRSVVRIARGVPYFHPNYKCLLIEAIPAYVMEETTTLKEVSEKASLGGGIRPIYVNLQGKVLAITNVTVGIHGELFLHAEDSDAPFVKYSDDLPLPLPREENIIDAEFVNGLPDSVSDADTVVHRSSAA